MLQKLITKLKNSLPEPIRKKMGGTEEDSEDSAVDELETDESDDAPEAAEDKKKKQISMIIRVVVILGIAYFALDEFVLNKDNNNQSAEQSLAKSGKKSKRKKKPVDQLTADKEVAKKETPAADKRPSEVSDSVPPTDKVTPIENINILDKNEAVAASSESESQLDTAVVDTPVADTLEPEITESKVINTSVDSKIDELVDNVGQSEATEEVKIPSQSTMTKPENKEDASMASKIVDNASETPPPEYDHMGRGLVYNCKDKYWACVDKPTYINCNKNMKWNSSEGTPAECVVQDIYSSDEDCAKVQKYNVSTSKPTPFCGKTN